MIKLAEFYQTGVVFHKIDVFLAKSDAGLIEKMAFVDKFKDKAPETNVSLYI